MYTYDSNYTSTIPHYIWKPIITTIENQQVISQKHGYSNKISADINQKGQVGLICNENRLSVRNSKKKVEASSFYILLLLP